MTIIRACALTALLAWVAILSVICWTLRWFPGEYT